MGRGRAKAKQVKVARQLKYNGGGLDPNRLRQELGVGTEAQSADHDDPYADEYDATTRTLSTTTPARTTTTRTTGRHRVSACAVPVAPSARAFAAALPAAPARRPVAGAGIARNGG